MSKKILCVMAGYDETTEKILSTMQQRLYDYGFVGNQTKYLLQHITLGTFKTSEEQTLKTKVEKAALESCQFDITFHHIGIFGGSSVLFVAPDPNPMLLKLKGYFGDTFHWTPHTTMLIDKPEVIYKALPLVADNFKAFQGQVQSVHLYEFWPARHICSYPLAAYDSPETHT